MCDCPYCKGEDGWNADDYLDYMYSEYKKTTDNPLPIEDWLKQFEAKE